LIESIVSLEELKIPASLKPDNASAEEVMVASIRAHTDGKAVANLIVSYLGNQCNRRSFWQACPLDLLENDAFYKAVEEIKQAPLRAAVLVEYLKA
jgi:hypothetical protein